MKEKNYFVARQVENMSLKLRQGTSDSAGRRWGGPQQLPS
jgi:hypothetical protein